MADPQWINAETDDQGNVVGGPKYTARELRRGQAMLLAQAGTPDRFGARSGVHPSGVDAVSLSGDTITVHNTKAVVYTALTTATGPYVVQLPEDSHTLASADGASDRKDIVIMRVYDGDEDASGMRKAVSEYVVGTPASAPSEPSVPIGAFRLATVDVPAAGTGSPYLTFNAPYSVSAGGVVPVREDSELPATDGGVYDGLVRWNQATDELQVHNGVANWETVGRANTPKITSGQLLLTNLTEYTSNYFNTGEPSYRRYEQVSFPSGLFTEPPNVTATSETSVAGTVVETSVDNITTDGCKIGVARATTTDTRVHWIAVQS